MKCETSNWKKELKLLIVFVGNNITQAGGFNQRKTFNLNWWSLRWPEVKSSLFLESPLGLCVI